MKQGQDMLLIIPYVGIHHHEPFLFCVCLVAALCAYMIPGKSVGLCAASVAQIEQRYLTLALGEAFFWCEFS